MVYSFYAKIKFEKSAENYFQHSIFKNSNNLNDKWLHNILYQIFNLIMTYERILEKKILHASIYLQKNIKS